MRLTYHADYALRLLMYTALKDGALVQIQEVADAYGISKNHLMKVAFQLGKQGFLDTVRGRGGGLRLARPPEEISIGDVVRKSEEDFTLVECFDPQSNTCVITGPCRLRGGPAQGPGCLFRCAGRTHPGRSRQTAQRFEPPVAGVLTAASTGMNAAIWPPA